MISREDGFTIIEALVALLIIAASISGLQRVLGSGFSAIRQAQSQEIALEHARSKLAEAGTTRPLVPGTTTGATPDGYRWQLDVRQREDGREAAAGAYAGYWVTATVAWRGGSGPASARPAELRSFKISRVQK